METTEGQRRLLERIKSVCRERYEEKYGYSEIVECWEDDDLLQSFVLADRWGTPEATAWEDVERRLLAYVGAKEEQYRAAVGPDVDCGTCGRRHPLEVCPG